MLMVQESTMHAKDLLRYVWSILLLGVTSGDITSVVRYDDVPLPPLTRVLGLNVTCGGVMGGRFAFITYTCNDIRVDGLRLAYGYYPGWGVDESCKETEGQQQLLQLCSLLLANIRNNKLHSAMVSNATCAYTPEERYMFRRQQWTFLWEKMPAGNGWMSSLSCMVES